MDETLFDNIDGTLWVTESIFDAPNVPNGKKHVQFRAPTLIYNKERRYVVNTLFHHFTQLGLINADYTEIVPFDVYLENSTRYEKDFILAAVKLNDENPVFMDRSYCLEPLPHQNGDLLDRKIPITCVPSEEGLESGISQRLQELVLEQGENDLHSHLRCYAIIDAAVYQQDGRFLIPDLMASGLTWQCLFKGESETVMENIAPYLVDITSHNHQWDFFHRRLISQLVEQPLGILIRSYADFGTVFHHLRKFTYVKNPETERWSYFRFYDPRAFGTIISLMDYAALASFMRYSQYIIYLQPKQHSAINIVTISDPIREIKGSYFRLTQRMCNYFAQQVYQAFIQKVDLFIQNYIAERSQISEGFRSYFITQHINRALCWGFSLERAVLLYVAARSMTCLPEHEWGELVKSHTCRFPLSQELRAKDLFGLVWHLSEAKVI